MAWFAGWDKSKRSKGRRLSTEDVKTIRLIEGGCFGGFEDCFGAGYGSRDYIAGACGDWRGEVDDVRASLDCLEVGARLGVVGYDEEGE